MYELITSLIAFVVGLGCIFFHKELVALQKSMASKQSDYISRAIVEYPIRDAHRLSIFVGIVFVISSLVTLFNYYN